MQIERKNVGLAILMSDKIDFKTKTIVRDKEGHYIMKKGVIQPKNISLVKFMYLCEHKST